MHHVNYIESYQVKKILFWANPCGSGSSFPLFCLRQKELHCDPFRKVESMQKLLLATTMHKNIYPHSPNVSNYFALAQLGKLILA
jgi:hypothetical protein